MAQDGLNYCYLFTKALLFNFLAALRFRQINVYCQEGEKQKDFYLYSKHKHLFVLFSLPTGPPGNLILLIHSHIYTGGGVLAPLKVCSVVLRRPVFVF